MDADTDPVVGSDPHPPSVTGLLARGAGLRELSDELAAAVWAGGQPFCVALVTTAGRVVSDEVSTRSGDNVLRLLAESVRAEVPGVDIMFSWDVDHVIVGFRDTSIVEASHHLAAVAGRLDSERLGLAAGLVEHAMGESAERLIGRAGDSMRSVEPAA
jgi:GGDEF domain-containing protein